MCDVVFITPNRGGAMVDASIGTLQLASILKEKGISCEILPFFRIGNVDDFENFVESALDMIRERQCRIVSFYTRCDSYHVVLRLAQRIKERWQDIYTVCGGPQSDITAEETVRQLPFVDFVCCGEGETTVYPFFSSLLQGTPDLSVPGLVYRSGAEVIKNPRPALIENLDDLPMLDYSLLYVKDDENMEESSMTIDVGRGCPFACTFCSTNSFWGRKYRLKSPQRICQEVKAVHDHFGDVRIDFSHDMFTLNREKVIETCKLLKQLDFPVRWGCSARLDCVDPELIDVMADAGLGGIYFGVETGSPRMQKLVHKNLKLDRAEEIIEYMLSKNLRVTTSFIFGFPEETEEDLSQTMAMIAKLLKTRRVSVQTHLCAFMVGTELSRKYKDELTPAEFYSDQTGDHAVEECKDLIQGYPELFQHMLEYKTDLRTKLKHFPLFYRVWMRMRPVYQYLSEKYPQDRLIDMYFDFVDANQELLDRVYDLPTDWCREVIKDDQFAARFADDERYDMITDLYRHACMEESQKRGECGDTTTVLCVHPGEARQKPLEACSRYVAVVNWKDGRCRVQCYPYLPTAKV